MTKNFFKKQEVKLLNLPVTVKGLPNPKILDIQGKTLMYWDLSKFLLLE
jgi:Leucine-rich repeat (LRR) protein